MVPCPRSVVALLVATACNSKSPSRTAPVKQKTPEAAAASEPAGPPSIDVPPDPREPLLARQITFLLETQHLRRREIDDAVSRKAFAHYIDRLDPGKLFLLRKHIEELRFHADRMDDQMRAGNLELARAGAALMAQRLTAVASVIQTQLADAFDFDRDEEVETDSDELPFAATEAELADRWRKVLKLQILEEIARMEEIAKARATASKGPPAESATERAAAADLPATWEGREKKARENLAKRFDGRFRRLARIDALEPAEAFLNAITTVYDPHTLYLAPVDQESFDIQISGSLEGIGALLGEDDHYIVVRDIVPGGASWRQGRLETGDLILAVAQQDEDAIDVADMRLEEVVQMIRGPKGTVVTLTVKKPDSRIEVISITRDVVEIEAAYARGALLDIGPKHDAMGYIYLPSFYAAPRSHRTRTAERNATDDVCALLEQFRSRKVGGVVIDLRGNGGGLLEHARDITGLFIKTGPVVQTRHADGKSQVLRDDDPSVSFAGEVVVLVDRSSASASEIVAGALQDYRRAVVAGTGPTHGKGTVQALLDLNRFGGGRVNSLGVLKMTIQQFFRVDGESTQWRGVIPDIELPDPAAHVETGERHLENSIPWSEVEGLEYTPWPAHGWAVDTLLARSKARRAAQPVFAKIEARAAYLKAHRDETRVPLKRETWLARRARDRLALESLTPDFGEGPARFAVSLVEYRGKKDKAPPKAGDKVGRADDALEDWRNDLSRDPWVEEALYVLADMAAASGSDVQSVQSRQKSRAAVRHRAR